MDVVRGRGSIAALKKQTMAFLVCLNCIIPTKIYSSVASGLFLYFISDFLTTLKLDCVQLSPLLSIEKHKRNT